MINLDNKYKKSLEKIKFIDLFAGIGGFRIALESFGAKCVFSSEIDSYAIQTYKENFNDIPRGDIRQISISEIPQHEILCAGFPCQPFSISGKQIGFNDSRGTLFFEIIKIVEHKRPLVLLLENVNNLITHNKGKTFSIIIASLQKLKYNVFYNILNSSNFNVPQSRKRLYIIAINSEKNNYIFNFPKGNMNFKSVQDILENNVNEKYFINRKDISINYKKTKNSIISEKPVRIGTINKGGQGERIYSISSVGITLIAEGGGLASKTGAYYVNNKIRKLTPREAARMQGFPDNFKIVVGDSQAWKQFGNSITIDVLQHILKELIDQKIIGK